MLYEALLDSYYAHQLYDDCINDLKIELGIFKKGRAKAKRRIKKYIDNYKSINDGKEPKILINGKFVKIDL